MLRRRQALCGAINPSADWYDPTWYAQEQALRGMKFTLLLDRNVYTRAVRLADCENGHFVDDHRDAAAVLCFAHCCGLTTDYTIAVLEHELDSGDRRFGEELAKFKRVWAAGAQSLADFALARSTTVTRPPGPTSLPSNLSEPGEAARPTAWLLNYGCALKLASLILDPEIAGDFDRMIMYLRWCYDEFFFSAGATVYGSLALAPSRKARMFKSLKGTNEERAVRGIRNAAWDMTLISEWETRQGYLHATRDCHLICSFDHVITDVASVVMSQGPNHEERLALLRERLISEWGESNGCGLYEDYEQMRRSLDGDSARPANQDRPLDYWENKVSQLEDTVRGRLRQHAL